MGCGPGWLLELVEVCGQVVGREYALGLVCKVQTGSSRARGKAEYAS